MGRIVRRIGVLVLTLAAMTVLLPVSPAAASAVIDCGPRCRLVALDAICWEKQDCVIPIVLKGVVGKEGFTITYRTVDGLAVAPEDYVAVPKGVITVRPDDETVMATVYVEGDKLTEPDEYFYIEFGSGRVDSDLVKVTLHDES